jgi:PAS domain-containing protein
VRIQRKDGSEIEALITSNIWQDEELNEAGFQGIVRDVTERQRIEAELDQHRHHLEELVRSAPCGCRRVAEPSAPRGAAAPYLGAPFLSKMAKPSVR